MRWFAELYDRLDRTMATNGKVAALVEYFAEAPPADAAWAVFFLCGERLRSPVRAGDLKAWARELAGLSDWMFDACYEAVGDRAETIALLVDAMPNRPAASRWEPTLAEAVTVIAGLEGAGEQDQRRTLEQAWCRLDARTLYLFTKLMTGALRVGVSKRLVVRALAEWSKVPAQAIFHRLMGGWQPSAESLASLLAEDDSDAEASRPYPYFLASPLTSPPAELGALEDWAFEWKWDGIRAQLVRRRGRTWLWSRGEELVTAQYPEIVAAAASLPDGTVLDGEIVAWLDGRPLPFSALQRRIGRKRLGAKVLADIPCILLAYDQLEADGVDLRERPLRSRRQILTDTLRGAPRVLQLSPLVSAEHWDELTLLQQQSRERGVEGLMLKRWQSTYQVGRVRGDWWKWKVAPFEVDAVLMYAQPGHGRRASLYTDYTFGLWNAAGELVPVAKAYSGLEDAEIRELDRWIRRNTVEKFGPVRAVTPAQVFELHFEHVTASGRHKSGFAVRFPRIARWRRDLGPRDADGLERLAALVRPDGSGSAEP
ncbi:MAG TPA: ATP-dependent DNA ligase [Pseudomonadales bacterium]